MAEKKLIYLCDKDKWREYDLDDTAELDKRGIRIGSGVIFGDCVNIGNGVTIGSGTSIGNLVQFGNGPESPESDSKIIVGTNITIGNLSVIYERVEIEDKVSIGNSSAILFDVVIRNGSKIGSRTLIDNNVEIGYRVKVGDDVTINKGTAIYDGASIGDDTTLGTRVIIKSGAKIGKFVRICDDAIIGSNARIEDDETPIFIFINGSRFPLSYWGEDRVDIGCQHRTIEHWIKGHDSIAAKYDFSQEEIAEYMSYVKFIASIHGKAIEEEK
jgi:UDP-3-O-[3-hydroxymyristoyl] glucosamine N-acyltransferase